MKHSLILAILQIFLTTSAFGFEAHEWGTFTSLVGSDGQTQDGMYHEDEELPDFVHGFGETQIVIKPAPFPVQPPTGCEHMKVCFSRNVLDNNVISQKMETPVIYFYGNKNETVNVNVKFPEGIITETFPAPTSSSPKYSENMEIKNGEANFKVDLMTSSTLKPPAVEADNIYGHARKVNSLMVKTNNEVEKFIFYRGLGRFTPKININSSGENFSFSFYGKSRPLAAFMVYVNEDASRTSMTPVIFGNRKLRFETELVEGTSQGIVEFSNKDLKFLKSGLGEEVVNGDGGMKYLVSALMKAGLKVDEAGAMVNTWRNGYFKTPGLRLLYIMPKQEVDEVLPLNMTPAPTKMERVFVARLEIMLQKEEQDLVIEIINKGDTYDIEKLGRLAEPKLRRAKEVYVKYGMQKTAFVIPNYRPGLTPIFDKLIEKSLGEETTPAVIN